MSSIFLTAEGLRIGSALIVSVIAHPSVCHTDPTTGYCNPPQEPGTLPGIAYTQATLHSQMPDPASPHKDKITPWQCYFSVEEMEIDFAEAKFGAHVWIFPEVVTCYPCPEFYGFGVRGPLDVNFDMKEDVFDVLAFVGWIEAGDDRADWNQDGLVDVFDALDFLNRW